MHLEKLAENAELLDRISQRIKFLKGNISIESLIAEVIERSGWNVEIVEQLNSFSEQEFKDAFLTSKSGLFLHLLNRFLSSWKNSGYGEKAVVVKIQKVLKDIAEMSRINRKRVKLIMPDDLENIED